MWLYPCNRYKSLVGLSLARPVVGVFIGMSDARMDEITQKSPEQCGFHETSRLEGLVLVLTESLTHKI